MGFLQTLLRFLRGGAREVSAALEDPARDIDVAIDDMTRDVAEVRRKVTAALVDQKKLSHEAKSATEAVQTWHHRAQRAVRGGDDDLAREALTKKLEAERSAQAGRAAMETHRAASSELKDTLRQLTQKLAETKRRRNLLVARAHGAEAKKKMVESLDGADSKIESHFARLEERATHLEAEAAVTLDMMSELGSLHDQALEARFAHLDGPDREIEASLDRLKSDLLRETGSDGRPRAREPGEEAS